MKKRGFAKSWVGRTIAGVTVTECVGPANSAVPLYGPRLAVTCGCGTPYEVNSGTLTNAVRKGVIHSCGCIDPRAASRKHGDGGGTGKPKAKEYCAWHDMRARCTRPTLRGYHRYGGRGITVCPEWDDYPTFLAHVGRAPSPKHSLDRIDNNGNYEPGNVRWATRREQAGNTRRNVCVTAPDGSEVSLAEVARRSNINPGTIKQRANALRGVGHPLTWETLTRSLA